MSQAAAGLCRMPLAMRHWGQKEEQKTHLMQVVDELGQVLNGVDVVVGWGRNERHPGLAAPQIGNVR